MALPEFHVGPRMKGDQSDGRNVDWRRIELVIALVSKPACVYGVSTWGTKGLRVRATT